MFLILLILLSQIESIKSILFAQKIGSDLITLSINSTAMLMNRINSAANTLPY